MDKTKYNFVPLFFEALKGEGTFYLIDNLGYNTQYLVIEGSDIRIKNLK